MLVEETGDRYGRWQDYECRILKDSLVEIEDQGAGGAGRVRLADFYNANLNNGKWQFTESVEYLRTLGSGQPHFAIIWWASSAASNVWELEVEGLA